MASSVVTAWRMRVLSVGRHIEHKLVTTATFRSHTSFLDYDLVILHPRNLLDEYSKSGEDSAGNPVFVVAKGVKLSDDLSRRRSEIAKFLEQGRLIVVHAPPPIRCVLQIPGRVELVDPAKRVLPDIFDTIVARGTNVDFKGHEPISSFWQQTRDYLQYEVRFTTVPGTGLFFVSGTDEAVGSYLHYEGGHLLFLPEFAPAELGHPLQPATDAFVNGLIELAQALTRPAELVLPPWSREYTLPGEKEEHERLGELDRELEHLRDKITAQEGKIEALDRLKVLFTGSGEVLRQMVKQVFLELSVQVSDGEPGRADLVLEWDSRVAVAEVKGVSKSAAEEHAAQLEKWCSEYYVEHNSQPKGVLIINAFKDTPLVERTKPPFPDQMLGYSANRGHCLMTGLQLLGLYLDCKDDPKRASAILDKIFETNGVFNAYRDWREFLAVIEPDT